MACAAVFDEQMRTEGTNDRVQGTGTGQKLTKTVFWPRFSYNEEAASPAHLEQILYICTAQYSKATWSHSNAWSLIKNLLSKQHDHVTMNMPCQE